MGVWIAVLCAAIAWSAIARVQVALRDPVVKSATAQQLLRTDPAFLFYVTQRIVESGGAPPPDLRADPNVEWPDTTDLAEIETLGQEFVVAWTYLAAGKPMPLLRWSIWVMGVWTSLIALGVFGMTYEITRRASLAALAAWLWAAMLVDYRTVGFVLIREDFAFPWIAAHLWLALRAARTRTPVAAALAGLTALAAASFWHATLFVLLIEMVVVLAWFLRSGVNPLAHTWAWIAVLTPGLLSLAVPVLRAKNFALSLPMVLAWALLWAGWIGKRRALSRTATTLHALAAAAVLFGLAKLTAQWTGSGADYGHVFALLRSKVLHLGRRPEDLSSLDYGARLLWQGPFRTADFRTFTELALAGLLALLAGLASWGALWVKGRGDSRRAMLIGFVAAVALATWLVERMGPLFGLSSAVLFAVVLERWKRAVLPLAVGFSVCAAHAAHQVHVHRKYPLSWYQMPPPPRANQHLFDWIRTNVPSGEAVASDFSTGAAILAFTRRPILNQPKYETSRSREKIEAFLRAVYEGEPERLAQFLRDHRTRWVVINRPFVGGNATDLGGILPSELPRLQRHTIWRTMSENPAEYKQVQGFTLAYETPASCGAPGVYRVYRLD